jgi:predicted enzyme related to lactoylglutathione lyase
LPGCGDGGPTLEVFSYDALLKKLPAAVNRPGFGHIAFETGDVGEARAEVLANGGHAVGEVVSLTTSAGSRVTWCYVTDPEGNVIELQTWS